MKVATSIAICIASISGAIALACWITQSGWPLLAFIFIPTIKYNDGKAGEIE